MVIHEEGDAPAEVSVRRPEVSKYVVVRNHVRELRDLGDAGACASSGASHDASTNEPRKKRKRTSPARTDSSAESSERSAASTADEDRSALEELRDVYYKCKQVLAKIESKYGRRLNLADEDDGALDGQNQRQDETKSDACNCLRNTKIVFDDSGESVAISPTSSSHVCIHNPVEALRAQGPLRIERESTEGELPDTLLGLCALLRDPELSAARRQAALDKVRALRAELSETLRYYRSALLERVRREPDAALAFVGTNLASLPGYS